MSTAYFQRDTAASNTGSPPTPVLTSRLASQTAGTASANIATGNIAAGATTNIYFFTGADDPSTDGSTGDYSVVLRFSVTNAQIQASVALARVNSSGAEQATTGLSDEQQSSNSPLTFNFTAADLGTWASGDRLRVRVQLRNQHGMNQACTLAVNTAADTIDTPFGEDEPEPAEGIFAVADEATVGWVGEAPEPTGPTGLTATPVSTTQIDLEWDAYTGATGYDIEIDDVVVAQGVTGTTYEATGLDPDTEYKFRVGAVL